MTKKVVTMTAYKRPEYTGEVLSGFSGCEGVGEYLLIAFVDGGSQEVADTIKRYSPFYTAFIYVNDTRVGCGENTKRALESGFAVRDFVIHAEDDVVPHKDYFRYMEWAAKKYADDKSVFAITGFNNEKITPEEYNKVYRRKSFCPWGWGTWKDRWEEMKSGWIEKEDENHSWDTRIKDVIRREREIIMPKLSRTRNIGRLGGTWGTEEKFDAIHSNQTGVWNVDFVPNGEYHE